MSSWPQVSIIIVNYNGRHLLEECLKSLFLIDYPREKYEVVVVDNNSHDNSVAYIKKNFPQVKLVESKQNLGFTGGNLLGLEHSTGEYIVLVNSDVRVDQSWLKVMVDSAQPAQVGMVSSKLLFATPFIEIKIKSKIIPKSDITQLTDYSPIGVIVEDVVCRTSELDELVWYESGFYEKKEGNITTRWTSGEGKILVPFPSSRAETYKLKIHGYPNAQNLSTPVTISVADKVIVKDRLEANEVRQHELVVKRSDIKSHLVWLVQNAGNLLLHDGFGKDRGSLIRYGTKRNLEFYDRDGQYYQRPAELLAVCGASCLIKRAVIDEVGFFDDYYFMYYEDLDLSFRVWKRGWNIVYSPGSVGYHRHRASTKTGSGPYFKALIERNHLYFTITHYPWSTIGRQLINYFVALVVTVILANILRFVDNVQAFKKWNELAEERLRATQQLFGHIRQLLSNRLFWQRRQKRSFAQARKLMY